MFPIIRLLAIIAVVGGSGTLIWYQKLSKEEQQAADRIAMNYARQLYGKAVNELTKDQASYVASLTKQHFPK
jgi:hypothetical protein